MVISGLRSSSISLGTWIGTFGCLDLFRLTLFCRCSEDSPPIEGRLCRSSSTEHFEGSPRICWQEGEGAFVK